MDIDEEVDEDDDDEVPDIRVGAGGGGLAVCQYNSHKSNPITKHERLNGIIIKIIKTKRK